MTDKPLVIITAVNGGAQQSKDGAFVPITPQEIAEEAALCEKAGASVVHFHGRDSEARNSGDPQIYEDVIRRVRSSSNLLIQTTNGIGYRVDPETGEHAFPSDKERIALLHLDPAPDYHGAATASIDFYHPDGGYPEEASFPNSGRFLRESIRTVYARGSTIEFEVPHVTALYRLHRYLTEEGIDPNSPYIMLVMPIFPAFVPNHRNFMHLHDEGRRLFPNAIRSHGGVGTGAFEAVTVGLALGVECVRVGFEDGLYMPDGKIAGRNYQLIEAVVKLAAIFVRRPATREEAEQILHLNREPLETALKAQQLSRV